MAGTDAGDTKGHWGLSTCVTVYPGEGAKLLLCSLNRRSRLLTEQVPLCPAAFSDTHAERFAQSSKLRVQSGQE